jgi:A nuclease of the HNH/ENDO VII superfamily with conserved WHH
MDPYAAFLRDVLVLAGEIYFRRVEAELWKFAESLDQWLHELFAHPRPDWRESFDQLLAQQEGEGRVVEPKSRQELLDFLSGWAETVDWNAASGDPAVPDGGKNLRPMDAVAAAPPKAANRTDEARRVDGPFIVPDASRPDTKVAASPPATKSRLPADSRGTWIIGKKGNGVFQFNDSAANRQAGIAGARIRFEGNYIAKGGFPPEAYYGGSAAEATVAIDVATGLEADNVAADAAMRVKRGDPAWKRPQGYTWHHAGHPGSTTMELVDTKLHAVTSHKGPAAELRAARRAVSARRSQKGKTESAGSSAKGNATRGEGSSSQGSGRRIKGKVRTGKGAGKPVSPGRATAGRAIAGARGKSGRPPGTGIVGRGMTVIAVYLTVREALQAAGILHSATK